MDSYTLLPSGTVSTLSGTPAAPATTGTSPTTESIDDLITHLQSEKTKYEDLIKKYDISPLRVADTNAIPGTIKNGLYTSADGNVYDTSQILKAQNPSFFQQYKYPLLAGGAGLALLGMQRPKMPIVQPTAQGPQFGLASNYWYFWLHIDDV